MKFKVGDKVKKVRDIVSNFEMGKIVTIVKSYHENDKNKYWAEQPSGNHKWQIIYEDEVELANVSLPINITSKDKYEHQAMQQFLFDNGCEWWSGRKIEHYGNNMINVHAIKRMSNDDGCFENAPTFTFADRDIIKEILNTSKPITEFGLNTEYTAEIDPNTETVKVGCQTFTFAKIKELASKLNP